MHTEKKKGFARLPLLLGGGLALGVAFLLALAVLPSVVSADGVEPAAEREGLSLITDTPEEGMQVALRLARMGVTETQPDREVLHSLRPEYAMNPDALIASSHVVAVHFQTVAEANDYWR